MASDPNRGGQAGDSLLRGNSVQPGAAAARSTPSRLRMLFRNPLTHLVMALVVVSLVQGYVVKMYAVHSTSMLNTLSPSERILVNRLAYTLESPSPGDIVTYVVPESWNEPAPFEVDTPVEYVVRLLGEITGIGPSLSVTNVKRVVAEPGQVISSDTAGVLLVDGEPIEVAQTGIDFSPGTANLTCPEQEGEAEYPCLEFVVPEGEYVVIGDNRPNSTDSLSACRGQVFEGCVRTVPEDAIVGQVVAVAFPSPHAIS